MIKKIENIEEAYYQIEAIYNSVGWSVYTQEPQKLKKALINSTYLFGYYEDNKLKGLIRGMTDYVSINYIQDILVLSELHGKGIGTKLVEFVFEKTKDVRAQVLLTDDDPAQLAFYKKLKMQNTRELINDPLNCFVKYDFELS
jgi:GNAT superfamily N-acetyltransferase